MNISIIWITIYFKFGGIVCKYTICFSFLKYWAPFHFCIFDISDYYYDDELQLILDVDNILSDSDILLEEVVCIIMY